MRTRRKYLFETARFFNVLVPHMQNTDTIDPPHTSYMPAYMN
jgi:hypothetical protein